MPKTICSMEARQTPSSFSPVPHISLHEALYSTYMVRLQTRNGVSSLSFDTLARFFVFPSLRAANELGISSRTLIRVSRSFGIRRWPFMSIRDENSIKRIRHEAIGNLARQLSKRSGRIPPAGSVLYPQTHRHHCLSSVRPIVKEVPLLMASPLDPSAALSPEADDVVEHIYSMFGASTGSLFHDRLELQNINPLESTTKQRGYQPRSMSMQDILGAALATV
jgi:hypothetical protein